MARIAPKRKKKKKRKKEREKRKKEEENKSIVLDNKEFVQFCLWFLGNNI
jgi:hypothetical protein